MTPTHTARPTPTLPSESRSQEVGRLGETAVTDLFSRHGWVVMRNNPATDFGVDLSAFKRSGERYVLPYSLSIQAKAVERVGTRIGAVVVRVKSSTLASWLWSNTPTVLVLYEVSSDRFWWSTPVAALPSRRRGRADTRTLHLDKLLTDASAWSLLSDSITEQWKHHQGVGAVMDIPLILQVLTGVALETDLWTNAGGTSEAVYHAAAVHTYRTVSALNALTGRTGSHQFAALASPNDEQVGLSWSHSLVRRGDSTLGVVSGIELQPWSEYLLEVFGSCGGELAAAIPRLQQIAQMNELGVPTDVSAMLSDITPLQLAIIDPTRAGRLTDADFPQISDRPSISFPSHPEYDNQLLRPMGRPMADSLATLRSSLLSSSEA